MTRIAIILVLILLVFGCKKQPTFEITGTVSNSPSSMIYLEKLDISGTVPYDSSKIDNKGRFKLKGEVNQPTFFLLKFSDQKFVTLLIDSTEKVIFSADFINFSSDYQITGSFGSEKVQQLNCKLLHTNSKIDSIKSLIRINENNTHLSGNIEKWGQEIEQVIANQEEFSKNFIISNPFSLASVLAIYQKFNDGNYIVQDIHPIKVAASALHSMYPNSDHAKTLYEDAKGMAQGIKNLEMKKIVETKGVDYPEIKLPDSSGKEIALSSFKGKTILIHFWSAFDQNSRIMNPVLRENYGQFKHKGFEIYQVCVDTIHHVWANTIKQDNLTWTNVGDMQGSQEALLKYNIRTVPSNYLIDKNGKIVAKDLFGPSLHKKLSEILN